MSRVDFTPKQQWLLGELDAPARAAHVKELLEQRLLRLLDWGFAVRQSSGGTSVSLGALTLITAYCEPDPPNADAVSNFVGARAGPADFRIETIQVEDKSKTGMVALEQLERALETLRKYQVEFATPGVPMGWACD